MLKFWVIVEGPPALCFVCLLEGVSSSARTSPLIGSSGWTAKAEWQLLPKLEPKQQFPGKASCSEQSGSKVHEELCVRPSRWGICHFLGYQHGFSAIQDFQSLSFYGLPNLLCMWRKGTEFLDLIRLTVVDSARTLFPLDYNASFIYFLNFCIGCCRICYKAFATPLDPWNPY